MSYKTLEVELENGRGIYRRRSVTVKSTRAIYHLLQRDKTETVQGKSRRAGPLAWLASDAASTQTSRPNKAHLNDFGDVGVKPRDFRHRSDRGVVFCPRDKHHAWHQTSRKFPRALIVRAALPKSATSCQDGIARGNRFGIVEQGVFDSRSIGGD